ncbi:MAG: DUF362 domain-containing protein [Nanoarchaeota archaeon]
MKKVGLVGCGSYAHVAQAIKKAIQHIGFDLSAFENKNVLLKPNLLRPEHPEKAVTTHPEVVRAMIKIVRAHGGRVSVGDSPAVSTAQNVAKKCGILQVCQEHDVPFVDLKTPSTRNGFHVAKELERFDLIVNLPKIKTHILTGMTCAAKNLYGCMPGKFKGAGHLMHPSDLGFAELVVRFAQHINPVLTVVDGIVGMEGNGPGNGTPRDVGVIVASTDAFAADEIVRRIIDLDVKEISTSIIVRKRNLLPSLELLGDPIDHYVQEGYVRARSRFLRYPRSLQRMRKRLFEKRPACDHATCILCRRCIKICPNEVISVQDKKLRFDYSRCIHCFCCHEICPVDAIDLKRPWQIR